MKDCVGIRGIVLVLSKKKLIDGCEINTFIDISLVRYTVGVEIRRKVMNGIYVSDQRAVFSVAQLNSLLRNTSSPLLAA